MSISNVGRAIGNYLLIFVAIVLTMLAFGCAAMAVWMMIQIFFITLWLTIKAALYSIGAVIFIMIARFIFGNRK